MFLAEAACVSMGLILYISGVQGQASSTCAFKHSSVDLHCSAKHPTSSMKWFTVDQNGPKYDQTEISSNEKYNISEENHSTLTIQALKESDERFYCCSETADEPENCWKRAIQLHVSGLKMKLHPAKVKEGNRVKLTCNYRCPLTINVTYIWYFNKRSMNLTESKSKLVLDPVSSEHAGSYSCEVKTDKTFKSIEETLTVQRRRTAAEEALTAAAAGAVAALFVIIPLFVFLWIRRRMRTSSECQCTEATGNMEELNPCPVYENILAQPTEQDDFHYSRVYFSKTQTGPLYSTIQPKNPKEQENTDYAVINLTPNTIPK